MNFFKSVTLNPENNDKYKQLIEEGYKVGITGHSLGGACAQYLAFELARGEGVKAKVEIHTETFNAPGILDVVNGMGIRCDNIDSLEIINHMRYSDYISEALEMSKHLGDCRYYAYDNPDTHGIIEFEKDLRKKDGPSFYSTRKEAAAVAAYDLERIKKAREANPPPKSIKITM